MGLKWQRKGSSHVHTDVKECAATVFHLCFILRVINGSNVPGVVSQKKGVNVSIYTGCCKRDAVKAANP